MTYRGEERSDVLSESVALWKGAPGPTISLAIASHLGGLERPEQRPPDFVMLDVIVATTPENSTESVSATAGERSESFAFGRVLLPIDTLCAHLAATNRMLEQRVQEQAVQVERLERLKCFFSPQLAELLVAGNVEDALTTHRREITVVFLDLRGFTAFAETSEPEEMMRTLREYHAAIGRLVLEYEGTLERFTGDGMMIFFNDPTPVMGHEERAVRMALAMRERVAELVLQWHRRGHELDFGVGIAEGYATIGPIGFDGRWDYGAVGTVTNVAARLCAKAKSGQILISQRLLASVETRVEAEAVGALSLKGFTKPVPAFNVIGLKTDMT